MAAYGLYTHIASNRLRSVLLLGGLFLLIYLMVFAGALLGEVVSDSGRPFDAYVTRALRDLVSALPYATIGAAAWIVIAYFFHPATARTLRGAASQIEIADNALTAMPMAKAKV